MIGLVGNRKQTIFFFRPYHCPTFVKDIFTLHYYLNTFISQVTVMVENFDYSGELPLVG